MNRRGFLKILAGTAAATATSYFFAPIGGWTSDVIAHANWSQCPPGCTDHLHRWQVEKVLADSKRRSESPVNRGHYGGKLDCPDCQLVAAENQRVVAIMKRAGIADPHRTHLANAALGMMA